jgi:hypothetical protein
MFYLWLIGSILLALWLLYAVDEKAKEYAVSDKERTFGRKVALGSAGAISVLFLAIYKGCYSQELPFPVPFPFNSLMAIFLPVIIGWLAYIKCKYPDPEKLDEAMKSVCKKHMLGFAMAWLTFFVIIPITIGIVKKYG